MTDVAEVHCVAEGRKIRARIAAYINHDGRRYEGVYNNSFNCRFPRNIRAEGKVFHVPASDVQLRASKNGTHFYIIPPRNVREVQGGGGTGTVSGAPKEEAKKEGVKKKQSKKAKITKTFEVSPECVICMGEDSSIVFVPCGHLCTCEGCAARIQNCCICRNRITDRVEKT